MRHACPPRRARVRPGWLSRYPSAASCAYAAVTTPREMPSSAARPRLEGSRAAGRQPARRGCPHAACVRAARTSAGRRCGRARPAGQLALSEVPITGTVRQASFRRTVTAMNEITVIGGGVAGLTAAITCAENGANVRLLEAHETLGGRARSTDGDYKANLGPHAIYRRRPLGVADDPRPAAAAGTAASDRGSLPLRRWRPSHPAAQPDPPGPSPPRTDGARRPLLPLVGRPTTATRGPPDFLSSLAGVYTFYHDPGELSAAFVWERTQRLLLTAEAAGPIHHRRLDEARSRRWSATRARSAWRSSLGERVDAVPQGPAVIVALELCDARELLGDDNLHWPSGRTLCLDLGISERRGDPWIDLRPRDRGLARALHGSGPFAGSPRRAARAGPDADPARRGADEDGRDRLERLLDASLRGLAGPRHVAPTPGDGRPQRRARSTRHQLAGPPGDRPRRRRIPVRRPGRGARLPGGGVVCLSDRGGQTGTGRRERRLGPGRRLKLGDSPR